MPHCVRPTQSSSKPNAEPRSIRFHRVKTSHPLRLPPYRMEMIGQPNAPHRLQRNPPSLARVPRCEVGGFRHAPSRDRRPILDPLLPLCPRPATLPAPHGADLRPAMTGHVYIMVNSRAPDRVKVGRTSDLRRRLAQHNRASNSVGHWTYHAHWQVSDARAAERAALAALKRHRVGGKRELFALRPSAAHRRVERAIAPWRPSGAQVARSMRGAALRLILAALIAGLAYAVVRRPDLVDAAGRALDWILLR